MRVSLAPSSPGEVLGLLRHVFRPTPTPEQSFNPGLQSAVPGQSKTASRSSDVDLDISVHVEKVGESPPTRAACRPSGPTAKNRFEKFPYSVSIILSQILFRPASSCRVRPVRIQPLDRTTPQRPPSIHRFHTRHGHVPWQFKR